MSKKYLSNTLPVLAIVFSSISIILFLVHILFAASHYQLKSGYGLSGFFTMLISVCVTTIIAIVPAIFFIICASKYLSGKKSKLLSVSLIMLSVSLLLLSAIRVISKPGILSFKNIKQALPDYIIILLYLLIIVFSILAVIKLNKQKRFKVFAIIAAATGLLAVAFMIGFNCADIILSGISFNLNFYFQLAVRIISDALYEGAWVFLYISLLFITLPYGKYKKIKVTLKQKQADI